MNWKQKITERMQAEFDKFEGELDLKFVAERRGDAGLDLDG